METKLKNFILGSLVGNTLGVPVNRKPHHIIRMYFKGIKEYTGIITSTQKPTKNKKGAPTKNPVPILQSMPSDFNKGVSFWLTNFLSCKDPSSKKIILSLIESKELNWSLLPITNTEKKMILQSKNLFPLDIASLFNGIHDERSALLFTIAMFWRKNSSDNFEAMTLTTINMGGLTTLTGGLVGGIMSSRHGASCIPKVYTEGLQNSDEILSLLS